MSDWSAFCPVCNNEIDLSVGFLHQADGKEYTCAECNSILIAYYDEDSDSGEGFVKLIRKEQ